MEKHTFNPPSLPAPAGYSQIVKLTGGTTVYIAGQVPLNAEGNLIGPGDLETQARQVFSNVVKALTEAGATTSNLVRLGIYVVAHDAEKLALIRRVRDEVIRDDSPPASTLLGVEALAIPEFLIEVDAIAVVD